MNQPAMATDKSDCAGMSQADGHCNLEVVCAAVPLLNTVVTYGLFSNTTSVYPQAQIAASPIWRSPLERVPIVLM